MRSTASCCDDHREVRRRPGRHRQPRGRDRRGARHARGCDRAVSDPAGLSRRARRAAAWRRALAYQHFGLKPPERAAATLPLFEDARERVSLAGARLLGGHRRRRRSSTTPTTCASSSARAPSGCARTATRSGRSRSDPGIVFAVVSLQVQYRAPARLDDELTVSCEPQRRGAGVDCASRSSICRAAAASAAHSCCWRRRCASPAWMRRASNRGACREFLLSAVAAEAES